MTDSFKSLCIAAVLYGVFLWFAPDWRDTRDCKHGDINGNKPTAEYCARLEK